MNNYNEREWSQQFVRYSAADCLRDAALWLDGNENRIVRTIDYEDNGNNPVLTLEGTFL